MEKSGVFGVLLGHKVPGSNASVSGLHCSGFDFWPLNHEVPGLKASVRGLHSDVALTSGS